MSISIRFLSIPSDSIRFGCDSKNPPNATQNPAKALIYKASMLSFTPKPSKNTPKTALERYSIFIRFHPFWIRLIPLDRGGRLHLEAMSNSSDPRLSSDRLLDKLCKRCLHKAQFKLGQPVGIVAGRSGERGRARGRHGVAPCSSGVTRTRPVRRSSMRPFFCALSFSSWRCSW